MLIFLFLYYFTHIFSFAHGEEQVRKSENGPRTKTFGLCQRLAGWLAVAVQNRELFKMKTSDNLLYNF